jgi:hypothetical protein
VAGGVSTAEPPIKKYAIGISFEEVCTIEYLTSSPLPPTEKNDDHTHQPSQRQVCRYGIYHALTGLTDKWFYKLISLGEFPKPIKAEALA